MTRSELINAVKGLIADGDGVDKVEELVDNFIESERNAFDQEYKHMTRKIKDYIDTQLDEFTDDFLFGVE